VRGGPISGIIVPPMNPRIAADYHEVADWLQNFVRSHAKREDERVEARLDTGEGREGRSFGVHLVLGAPPRESAPIELDFRETADGRTRFAWCLALAERVRAAARELAGTARSAG
jgi:hypothetical protein